MRNADGRWEEGQEIIYLCQALVGTGCIEWLSHSYSFPFTNYCFLLLALDP